MRAPAPETTSITAGAISALGASTCCVLPLVLVSAGLGGAWVAQLRALERFQWVFIGLAAAAFDHKLLEILREGGGRSLAGYSLEQLQQAGDSEFLNWMVVLGAVGEARAAATFYIPDQVATGWGFASWIL